MDNKITTLNYGGRYSFTDRNGRSGKQQWVTLKLKSNFYFKIDDEGENTILSFELPHVASAKKEKYSWSQESFIRFELPYKQEITFYPFPQDKTDEIVEKFYELKHKQEKEDEERVGYVQKLIDDFVLRMIDYAQWHKGLDISSSGKELFNQVHACMHTLGPHIPNVPHTEEDCIQLIRARVEKAIAEKELTGSIGPENDTYYP